MLIINNNPKKIIMYNNTQDGTIIHHIIPFIKFMKDSQIHHLFDIYVFKYNGVLQQDTSHHSVPFPNNKKHIDTTVFPYLLKRSCSRLVFLHSIQSNQTEPNQTKLNQSNSNQIQPI